jgi:hypothetical protein
MSAYVVRLKSPLLRVPLWSLLWPLRVFGCVVNAITSGNAHRLLAPRFWTFQLDMLVVGIDGF